MIPVTWEQAVRSSKVMAGLGDFDFHVLLDALVRRGLEPGQVLIRQGEPGDSMVIVADGALDVMVREADGSDRLVCQLGPGQVVGEMSCLDPAPRSATVLARQRSWVFLLDRSLLRSLQEHAPAVIVAFYRGLIRIVTERLRETDSQIARELAAMLGTQGARAQRPSPVAVRAPVAPQPRVRPKPATRSFDISAIPALSWLPQHDFELLQSVAPPVVYPRSAELCREGDPGASCFLVLDGQVDVVRDAAGEKRRLATLGPGAFVGQLALVDRIPRSATVVATSEVSVMEVPRDVFERLLASASSLGLRFQEQVVVAGIRQLRLADQRLASVFAAHDRQARGRFLSTDADLRQREAAGEYIRTALQEWGISMADLDNVEFIRPDGIAPAGECRPHNRGR